MKHVVISSRLLWLLPAGLLLVAAGHQVAEHRAVPARIVRSGPPRARVPPTVYGEHPALALALACLATILIILAFRPPPPSP